LERGRVRLLIRLVTAKDRTLSFRGTGAAAFGIGGLHRVRCRLGPLCDLRLKILCGGIAWGRLRIHPCHRPQPRQRCGTAHAKSESSYPGSRHIQWIRLPARLKEFLP
jgi:hypothetical protein